MQTASSLQIFFFVSVELFSGGIVWHQAHIESKHIPFWSLYLFTNGHEERQDKIKEDTGLQDEKLELLQCCQCCRLITCLENQDSDSRVKKAHKHKETHIPNFGPHPKILHVGAPSPEK